MATRSSADLALEAMRAGLRGERLPNFGNSLDAEQLRMVNSVYEEARNWSAGSKFAASRAR